MNTKVAILGKLPTKFNAPFDNKKWDIWTLNKHIDCEKLPRVAKKSVAAVPLRYRRHRLI
jgi:hypothetical protein